MGGARYGWVSCLSEDSITPPLLGEDRYNTVYLEFDRLIYAVSCFVRRRSIYLNPGDNSCIFNSLLFLAADLC